MRRLAAGVGAGAGAVLLAGVAVLALRGADSTTSYDEQAAVDAYRAAAGPSASPSASPARRQRGSVPSTGGAPLASAMP